MNAIKPGDAQQAWFGLNDMTRNMMTTLKDPVLRKKFINYAHLEESSV